MKKSAESSSEGKMKNRIRHSNGADGTQLPQKFQNKKSTVASDDLGNTDRDNKGRFVKGNKAQMKTEIGKRARYERLPDMRERQRLIEEVDELIREMAEGVKKNPLKRVALMYVGDGLRQRASMELAFRMTAEVIDEAAYVKTGSVIPHGCLEAWNKNSQELRRWLKVLGLDLDGAGEEKTLQDVLKEIESEKSS